MRPTVLQIPLAALGLAAALAGARPAATALAAAATSASTSAAGFPADPADSLYRQAREALNGGDYRRAASLFHDVQTRFPSSAYLGDAMYYEAFALSRTGRERDLRASLDVLREQRRRFPKAVARSDAAALETRIRGELAKRGSASDADAIVDQARASAHASGDDTPAGCNDDDAEMRVAALNALLQMDSERALPILKQVLARRDPCSATLRRKAVFLVAQKEGDDAADVLLGIARTDPDAEVRSQAVFWLGNTGSARALSGLDSILHQSKDADLREKALFALSQHEGEGGGRILREFAASDAPTALRAKAVFWLSQGATHRADDAEFLRTLFAREKSEEIRDAIVQGVAQRATADDTRWLLDLVQNGNESVEVRKKALFWAGQGQGVSAAQLAALYDKLPAGELKEHAIFVLAQRHDTAATDKLIDIARHDSDREMRKKALFWLGQENDPRVKQLLMEILGQ